MSRLIIHNRETLRIAGETVMIIRANGTTAQVIRYVGENWGPKWHYYQTLYIARGEVDFFFYRAHAD